MSCNKTHLVNQWKVVLERGTVARLKMVSRGVMKTASRCREGFFWWFTEEISIDQAG